LLTKPRAQTYVKKAEDLEQVNNTLIPPLLEAVLGDYNRNIPAARDAEVLNVMATIVSRLGVRLNLSLCVGQV
jgi:exportin-1